ncbi:penicillin binding transpeptidase domain protein [Bordetella holmesii 35009]|nr:penicillin binding transpeptidase domain protein [Bordetella holmesii 35009]
MALDPDTAEVLAFVSQPSFDPNLFRRWHRRRKLAPPERVARSSVDQPAGCRGTYPIGFDLQAFVGLAALELGKRRATDRMPDPDTSSLAARSSAMPRAAVFGMTDMHKALVVSSDTYFYSLGPEIGVNALHDFSKQFGFGQITGIDLEGERTGVLPSTDWKRRAYKDRERQRWYAGETISVAVARATTHSRCCSWLRQPRRWPTTACTAGRTWSMLYATLVLASSRGHAVDA